MSSINVCNVHRSNLLQDHAYGSDFIYEESMLAGEGPKGREAANGIVAAMSNLGGPDAPAPGEGPSRAEREAGGYEMRFTGFASNGSRHQCLVTGDQDPGYGSTAKMIAETAVCLLDFPESASGGIWTPCAALGSKLIDRLSTNAGLTVTTLSVP